MACMRKHFVIQVLFFIPKGRVNQLASSGLHYILVSYKGEVVHKNHFRNVRHKRDSRRPDVSWKENFETFRIVSKQNPVFTFMLSCSLFFSILAASVNSLAAFLSFRKTQIITDLVRIADNRKCILPERQELSNGEKSLQRLLSHASRFLQMLRIC